MKTISKKQWEFMITQLLTDCVATRRMEDSVSRMLNAYGGTENQLGDTMNNTISVSIHLTLLEYDKIDTTELWPHLLEYYYGGAIDVSSHEKAEDIAMNILIGWNKILRDFDRIS
jgi:hypothetical protein